MCCHVTLSHVTTQAGRPWAAGIPWSWNLLTKKTNPNKTREVGDGSGLSIGLPYVKGLSEQLNRTFKQYGVNTYHKPVNTLRSMLVKPKDKDDITQKCNVIYQLACSDCGKKYVGETSRSFGIRRK